MGAFYHSIQCVLHGMSRSGINLAHLHGQMEPMSFERDHPTPKIRFIMALHVGKGLWVVSFKAAFWPLVDDASLGVSTHRPSFLFF